MRSNVEPQPCGAIRRPMLTPCEWERLADLQRPFRTELLGQSMDQAVEDEQLEKIVGVLECGLKVATWVVRQSGVQHSGCDAMQSRIERMVR